MWATRQRSVFGLFQSIVHGRGSGELKRRRTDRYEDQASVAGVGMSWVEDENAFKLAYQRALGRLCTSPNRAFCLDKMISRG